MKKLVAKKWVKALRSGEYLQTEGVLTNKNEKGQDCFCCLGVLTNLYVQENGNGKVWDLAEGYEVCPREVMKWSGLQKNTGKYGKGNRSLAHQNDDGKSFLDIADIIENNVELL